MCGIVGFCSNGSRLSPRLLRMMRDTLTHRGPDDAGCAAWDEQGTPVRDDEPAVAGLGHRRLSIIDLSAAGRQPLACEDGHLSIVYNGECYNFETLREPLLQKGHRFVSRTDTEVILHLLEEEGIEKTLAALNGMFAVGVWDQSTRSMILARDRLGKKPLYYALRPDGSLLFASEMKALLASGMVDRRKIDEAALIQCWQFGYAMGERTIFQDIRRLLPGHYAVWKDGRLNVRRYWDCPFGVEVRDTARLDDLTDELEALVSDAIRIRLKADVPIGLFLSGGLDSSLIAAITTRVVGRSLTAFTIQFESQGYDESPSASAVARHLGIEHRVLPVTEELKSSFPGIARQFDEPFGDSSAVPTFFVCKLARQYVTVVLTGDGGDELFGGYDAYGEALGWWGNAEQRRLFRIPRHGLDRLGELRHRLQTGGRRLNALNCGIPPIRRHTLFPWPILTRAGHKGVYGDRERCYSAVATSDMLSQMQYLDLKTYLPDDILVKVDRMSMANSLECRCPLLDYRIAEFAARLPYSAKIDRQGVKKIMIRRLLSRFVPDRLTDRPKKGFSIPWMQMWTERENEDLRIRWRRSSGALLKPSAADWVFRDGASNFLHWSAFSTLLFMEANA